MIRTQLIQVTVMQLKVRILRQLFIFMSKNYEKKYLV